MLRKVIFSLLSILVLAVIGSVVWHFSGAFQREEAILFPEEGSASIRRGSGVVSASSSQVLKLREGDTIQTGSNSRAILVASAWATVELTADTEALVRRLHLPENSPATIELEVRRGNTWHELSFFFLEPDTRYEVVTPSTTVVLSAGRHRVAVDDDGSTQVEVSRGVAKVQALSSEVEVWSGEYTSVAIGRAPAVPRPLVARFLFVSEREGNADICLIDEDGQEFQLTQDRGDDLAPAWSPDGSRIAFETARDGNSEIYVMSADGSSQVSISHHPADDHSPVWSPDGTKIGFDSLRNGGRHVYVMNADGTDVIRLTYGPGLSFSALWSSETSTVVISRVEADSNGDGLMDLRDMAFFSCLDPDDGSPQSCWRKRRIYDQMLYPWALRLVG